DEPEHRRPDGDRRRHREPADDELGDRGVAHEGVAEARAGAREGRVRGPEGAAGEDAAQEVPPLLDDRLVQPHEGARRLEPLGRARAPAGELRRGGGQEHEQRVREERDGEQHERERREPGREEPDERHLAPPFRRRGAAERGSSASRRPSPNALNASVIPNSASPGKIRYTGSTENQVTASPIDRPQEGVGGGTPTPRNESAASAPIAPGIEMVVNTTIVAARLGSTWRNSTCAGEAPSAREARTNPALRSAIVCPRTTRAIEDQPNRPMTSTSRSRRGNQPGATAPIAIMKTSAGRPTSTSISLA